MARRPNPPPVVGRVPASRGGYPPARASAQTSGGGGCPLLPGRQCRISRDGLFDRRGRQLVEGQVAAAHDVGQLGGEAEALLAVFSASMTTTSTPAAATSSAAAWCPLEGGRFAGGPAVGDAAPAGAANRRWPARRASARAGPDALGQRRRRPRWAGRPAVPGPARRWRSGAARPRRLSARNATRATRSRPQVGVGQQAEHARRWPPRPGACVPIEPAGVDREDDGASDGPGRTAPARPRPPPPGPRGRPGGAGRRRGPWRPGPPRVRNRDRRARRR